MGPVTHYDLAVIGTGSGNTIVDHRFSDWRVAVVEEAKFGGTCLNVGCIPTKMFVYPADLARSAEHGPALGVETSYDGVRWRDIRDRIFGRIDPISDSGRDYRVQAEHTDAYLGRGRFVGDREIEVEITRPGSTGELPVGTSHRISADQVVIATGSSPVVPPVVRESGVTYHTSDSVMRIAELPASMVILGGGVIAAEFAHVFSALGVQVTIVNRSARLLRSLDEEISSAFTDLAREQWEVRTGVEATAVRAEGDQVVLDLDDGSTVSAELLLVATGRAPNSTDLGLETTEVRTHDDGRVVVDEHGRTGAEGVFALGDVSSPYQLKHVANHEARVVAHNLVHPEDLQSFDHRFVPSAIFSHPQLATVGLTEAEARLRPSTRLCRQP